MLIPRQQQQSSLNKISVKKFNDSGFEVKPIVKKMPQHSHVNELLHTAAAGNGVIDDVDALLTPIQRSHSSDQEHQQDQSANSTKERTERNLWRNDEVLEMMFVMQQTKALEKLNDKQMKSENVFKDVEMIMRKNGFVKKSHLQIWTKWKFLKSTYMTSRRNGVIPRMIPLEIYNVLHQMISGVSECGTSTNGSMDGDNSNALMMSGTSEGKTNVAERDTLPNTTAANPEEDDSYGMAHPIFGFRLGMVKNEPVDNGYDVVENNGSATENIPMVEVALPRPKAEKQEQKCEKQKPLEKSVTVPHRGRGRPPKNLPRATSTPSASPSTSDRINSQLPPLRVAPFAKATNAANALAANRPPPPLTMPPTPRPIHVANISSLCERIKNGCGSIRLTQPKLLPKPGPSQAPNMQSIRLPKEISVHSSRGSSTPSPSYPKMKQVPMRKTPYSLRPDRAIPDLDESFSPPPPPIPPEKQRKFEEVPSISHLVMQSQNGNRGHENGFAKKRRMDQQPSHPTPTKFKKIPSDDEDHAPSQSERRLHEERMYSRLMQSAIGDLSASLRKTQTQMMREFFKKQHELLQVEHEFQMQQDRLIMEAFQMQTHEIMSSVRDLIGSIASDKLREERRVTLAKHATRRQRFQNESNESHSSANEDSLQDMQERQINMNGGDTTDMQQEEDCGRQQLQLGAEEVYTDEEELQEMPDHLEEPGHENGNIVEEAYETGDDLQQQQPLDDPIQSPLNPHQPTVEVNELNGEEDDDDEDDDDDDDDDDEDDDEDSDSDDDDDDDNENSQAANDNEQDQTLPNGISTE